MAYRVLFVCTGNTCRSPLAEVIARRLFEGEKSVTVHTSSAGTHAEEGGSASAGSLEIARENGLDLEAFQSRVLTREMLDEADLVLVMEPGHRSSVLGVHPQADMKTMLLGELSGLTGRDAAVPDPFGGSIDSYRRTFLRLATLLRDGLPRLLEVASRRVDRT